MGLAALQSFFSHGAQLGRSLRASPHGFDQVPFAHMASLTAKHGLRPSVFANILRHLASPCAFVVWPSPMANAFLFAKLGIRPPVFANMLRHLASPQSVSTILACFLANRIFQHVRSKALVACLQQSPSWTRVSRELRLRPCKTVWYGMRRSLSADVPAKPILHLQKLTFVICSHQF